MACEYAGPRFALRLKRRAYSRWLRLLFTREFDMPSAMQLWDGLFAADPTVELAPWVCVAMLIRIRNQCRFTYCAKRVMPRL